MEIKINLNKKPDELSFHEFLLLCFHDYIEQEDLGVTDETLYNLEQNEYIKITGESSYELRAKALEFKAEEIEEYLSEDNLDWIDEYRNLFKEKSSAVGIRGSKTQCVKKMKDFIKKNKATKEEIIEATKLYLKSVLDVRFLQQADYFIFKNGGSRLEAFIEEYKLKGSTKEDKYYEEI